MKLSLKEAIKLFFAPIAACLILIACTAGKGGMSSCGKPKIPVATCEGTYQGQVDPPPHSARIYARNRQLREGGKLGGGVDGGMYLQGAFDFKADKNCKITGDIILHGWRIALSGNANKSGAFSLLFDGGHGKGQATKGVIKGKVHEGGGREWVYGVMVGKFIPIGKP